MDNLLPTFKPPSNKSADLLNVVNKNRKLAALQDGTVLSSPRILKAFLLTNIREVRRQIAAQVVINKWFICGKCLFGYNFGLDDGAEWKIGTHKELIAFNILKYEYCVNQTRDMSWEHFTENRKLLTDWWPV